MNIYRLTTNEHFVAAHCFGTLAVVSLVPKIATSSSCCVGRCSITVSKFATNNAMGKLEDHFDPEYLELLDSGMAKWIMFCDDNKDFADIVEEMTGLDIWN